MEKRLTIAEIAEIERCTPATVYNKIKAGRLPVQNGFGPMTVLEADYRKYVNANRSKIQMKGATA